MLLGISFWRAAGRPESPRPRAPRPGTSRGAALHTPSASRGSRHTIAHKHMPHTCHMHMHIHVIHVHAHVHVHAHACDITRRGMFLESSPQRPGLLTGSRPPGLRPGLHPRTRSFERPNGTYFLKYRGSWVWTVHVDGSDGPRLVTTTRGGQSNLQEKVGRCTLDLKLSLDSYSGARRGPRASPERLLSLQRNVTNVTALIWRGGVHGRLQAACAKAEAEA